MEHVAATQRMSAPRWGSPLPHLHRDFAHCLHVCAGAGPPLPHRHICTGTGPTPVHTCAETGLTPTHIRARAVLTPPHGQVSKFGASESTESWVRNAFIGMAVTVVLVNIVGCRYLWGS